jgi:hypothetical protein
MKQLIFRKWSLLFCGMIIFISCKPLIATYDQYSYTQLSSVKVDVLNLLDKSNESYSSHEQEVEDVLTEVHKAMEYDIHKPHNEIMAKMWAIQNRLLVDSTPVNNNPNSNLKGIIATWKKKGQLSSVFATEAEGQIADGFDLLLELESKKIKPDDVRVSNYESTNK